MVRVRGRVVNLINGQAIHPKSEKLEAEIELEPVNTPLPIGSKILVAVDYDEWSRLPFIPYQVVYVLPEPPKKEHKVVKEVDWDRFKDVCTINSLIDLIKSISERIDKLERREDGK